MSRALTIRRSSLFAVAPRLLKAIPPDATGLFSACKLAVYEDGNDGGPRISDVPRDDAFDRWAAQRDAREERAVSTRYVSREVTGYEDLDEYGTWREVPEYGPIWMPAVQAGWAPYQSGHWAWVAPWGWTWIDEAPWGFAPFHYGRWVHFAGDWCWAPGPRYAEPVYAPALVGWVGGSHWSVGISIGASVGWFPLGWNEVYVPSYPVSNTYVRNVNVTNIHVTNEYVNNYIVNNTTVNNGVYAQKTTDDRQLDRRNGGMQFRNQAIPGAVTATTQAAFASAQPVRGNRVAVPREARVAGATAAPPPVIAPTAKSIGRPAPGTDRGRAQVWDRDVVTRAPVPPAATPAANLRRGTPEAGQLPGMGQPNRGSRGDRPIGPAAEPQRGEPGRAGQAPVRVRDAAPDAQPRGRDDRAGDGGRASDRGIGVLGGRPPMDRTGRPAGREPVNGAGAPRSRDDRPQDRAAAPGVDRGQAERGVRTPNEQQNRPAAREERPRAFAPQPSRDDRPPAREAAPAVDRGPAVRDSRPPRDPPYRPSVREDRPQGRESAPALPAVREGRPASRDVIEPPRDTRPQYQPPTRSYAPIDAPIRAPERESRPPVERAPTAVEYRAPPREFVPPPMREVRPEPRPEARPPPPPPPRQEPRPAPQADPHPDRANAGRRNDDPRRG